MTEHILARLKHKSERNPNDCWVWNGCVNGAGYGEIGLGAATSVRVHRLAWELLVGPIPEDRILHHTCENKRCWNPAHLELVTRKQHTRHHRGGGEYYCSNGHEYTKETTWFTSKGFRKCRICMRESYKRADAKRRG